MRTTLRLVARFSVIATLALASSCGDDIGATCATLRANREGFRAPVDSPEVNQRQIATLDTVIATATGDPAARGLVDDLRAVREYAALLFAVDQPSDPEELQRHAAAVTKEFFGGASERVDDWLRSECRIDLGGPANPFALISNKDD